MSKKFNLCTTYILPLVGLNKWCFGSTTDKFINAYISEDNNYVVVELTDKVAVPIKAVGHEFTFTENDKYYMVFKLQSRFVRDIELFREGKYSEFSSDCKEVIRRKSGLKWGAIHSSGRPEWAIELLKLDKDKDAREAMEAELDVKIDPKAELISIPGEDNFFNLNLNNKLS